MEGLRFVMVLLLSAAAIGCSAGNASLASQKPWSQHCSAKGIPFRSAEEASLLEAAATRCEAKDACVLACNRSGCADDISGGCAHVCFRGLPGDLAERANSWAQRPSCRLPPNNSFK